MRVRGPPQLNKIIMPYYDYECTECGAVFEYFQKMDEPELEVIPHCNPRASLFGPPDCMAKVVKKISAPSLKFIGKGFYCNDYK